MPIPSHAHEREEARERKWRLLSLEQREWMRRSRVAVILGLLWALVMLGAEFSGVLRDFSKPLEDWQMTLATPLRPPDQDLALLAIDRIPGNRPWPWSRLDYSLAMHSLIPFGAQSVVLEMLLNDRDTQYTAFDDQFGNVVGRYDRVIFAGAVLRMNKGEPEPAQMTALTGVGNSRLLPLFQGLLWPLATFAGPGSTVGVRNLLPEAGGQVRRLPLVFRFKGKLIPSLALQALAQRLKAEWSRSLVRLGEAVELKDAQGQLLRRIPIDEEGRLWLRYRGSRALPWTVSFENVLLYAQMIERGEKPPQDLRDLRRRQVWIGRTDRVDFEPVETVIGRMTPVEVQMLAVRQMLDEDYLRPWPKGIVGLLFLVTAVAGSLLAVRVGPVAASVLLAAGGAGMIAVGAWLFRTGNYHGPLLTFNLLLLGIWVTALAAARWDFSETPAEDKNQLPLDLK